MKKNKALFYFIIINLTLSICHCQKKTPQITIEGLVTNSVSQTPITSIEVKVFFKEISGNTFSNTFKLLKSQHTSSTGKYSISFDYRKALEYKIEIQNQNYFTYSKIINPDNLSTKDINTISIEINPKSVIKLKIKNQVPQNTQDNIVFTSINNSCSNCYTPPLISLNGTNIDTTFYGNTLSQKYWVYSYYVTKNNFTQSYHDSIFCMLGDTNIINILY